MLVDAVFPQYFDFHIHLICNHGRFQNSAIFSNRYINFHPAVTPDMSELLDRIMIDPTVRNGKPVIRGTRITVSDILEYLAGGMSEGEILADFPDLSHEDVMATLAFAAQREQRLFSVV